MTGQPYTEYASPDDAVYRDAACKGRTTEFVELGEGRIRTDGARRKVANARAICLECPVLDECRAWALTDPDPAVGLVAGGMSTRERQVHRRGRPVVRGVG